MLEKAKKEVYKHAISLPSTRHLFVKSGNPEKYLEYDGLRYVPLNFEDSSFEYDSPDNTKIVMKNNNCDYFHTIRDKDGNWQPFYNSYLGIAAILDLSDDAIDALIDMLSSALPLLDMLKPVRARLDGLNSPDRSQNLRETIDKYGGGCVTFHYAFLLPAGDESSRFIMIPHISKYWRDRGNLRVAYSTRTTDKFVCSIPELFEQINRYYKIHKKYF